MLLSIVLLGGIFVDPAMAFAHGDMNMLGHEMVSDCVACESPMAVAICVRHCLDRASDHADVYREINVSAPIDVVDGLVVYENVGFDFSYYYKPVEFLEADPRLAIQLNIQKRE